MGFNSAFNGLKKLSIGKIFSVSDGRMTGCSTGEVMPIMETEVLFFLGATSPCGPGPPHY
jgi:hypothetical protein